MAQSLRCSALTINLGHQQPYVDDDVHIYSSAMRPGRPTHSHGSHRPVYNHASGNVKPGGSQYESSYATWNHDRPNDIGHDRPTYTTRPYHTVQMDYPQDDNGYPAGPGIHVPIETVSSNGVDYSRYRGNRMRTHTHAETVVAPSYSVLARRTMCVPKLMERDYFRDREIASASSSAECRGEIRERASKRSVGV